MRILIFLLILLLTACSALPSTFTDDNVMNLRPGIHSEAILKTFGKPKNVSVSGCGPESDRWTCTIWEYGHYSCGSARFYFQTAGDQLILNSYDIDRDVCY